MTLVFSARASAIYAQGVGRPTRAISMRVTIIKRPDCALNDMLFTGWRVGETYDVSFEIASVLIVEGCGRLEMRGGADRRREKRWGEPDRRHKPALQDLN